MGWIEDRLGAGYLLSQPWLDSAAITPGGSNHLSLLSHRNEKCGGNCLLGSYLTIWLAKDEKSSRYVAIKVAIADNSLQESDILRRFGTVNGEHPGKPVIATILDEFRVKGPNGEHRCVVRDPARMSLSDARDASYTRLFPLPVVRAIAAQLIQAVAFLHSQGVAMAVGYLMEIPCAWYCCSSMLTCQTGHSDLLWATSFSASPNHLIPFHATISTYSTVSPSMNPSFASMVNLSLKASSLR